LRSVQADTITSCKGVVHLPAGHHTFAVEDNCTLGVYHYCPRCTIVGEPGAVLDALVSTHNRVIALNGSLVLRGTGQSPCLDIQGGLLEVHGNVTIQDCHNMNVQSLFILGPNSGEDMVSVTNSSTTAEARVRVTNNARVIFTDAYFPVGENELYIENSHAIFERTRAYSEYAGYGFTNSTIIASNTSFGGGHNKFDASNSVLNFTNTSVFIVTGNMGISVANSSLDVTCASPGPVFDVGPYNTYVSFSDSMVRFRGCSCHLDQAIRNKGGPVSIQGGSMTFSSCQPYGGAAKANPVVVV